MVLAFFSTFYFFINKIFIFYTKIHQVFPIAKSFNEDIVPEQSALERSNHKFIRTGTATRKERKSDFTKKYSHPPTYNLSWIFSLAAKVAKKYRSLNYRKDILDF